MEQDKAVQLLASNETSARTAGIYSLYQLIIKHEGEKYRVQVVQILCSHIRSKTQEPKYQNIIVCLKYFYKQYYRSFSKTL